MSPISAWVRILFGIAAVAAGVLPVFGSAWVPHDFLATTSSTARQAAVASTDGRDVIVAWEAFHPSPSRIYVRPMRDREWLSAPVLLGNGRDPVAFTDVSSQYRVMYVSGTTIACWTGAPGELDGPTYLTAGSAPISGQISVSEGPDGVLYLAWKQGNTIWWTFETPDSGGWQQPYLAAPFSGDCFRIVPHRAGDAWQPRIYYWNPALTALAYRQYNGASWGPETLIASVSYPEDTYTVAVLDDGRHAIFYSMWAFCGNFHAEENAAGEFDSMPDLWSWGGGPCWESDTGPAPIAAAVGPSGRLNVIRYEACWEWHDYDIWGCSFRLFWQWRLPQSGAWIYAGEGEFPTTSEANSVDVIVPRDGITHPTFAWSGYTGVHLRIMDMHPTADVDATNLPAHAIRAFPNPTAGTVRLDWHPEVQPGARAALAIFDAGGRRVRTFEMNSATTGSIRWDGTDARGVPVPSGVYFARFVDGVVDHPGTMIVLAR